LQPEDPVRDEQRQTGEDDHRSGIPLPRLLVLRVYADHPVERAFHERQPLDPALEDGGHVRTEKAPRDRENHDQGDDGEGEAH
jgi:hypothetical protein